MWETFVDLMRAGIFSAAHLCGGSLGGGILLVSLVVRLGLLPLTLRMARRAREQQRKLAGISGDIERIQRRHAKDPVRLYKETQALYRDNGIRFLDPSTFIGMVVQAPLLAGLFSAVRAGLGHRVRFAWVADLAQSNGALVVLVAALSGAAAMIAPMPSTPPNGAQTAVLITVLFAIVFLWSASSAVVLSWASGSLVTIVQNLILARDVRRETMMRA
jgi:YidC/Oxa1 family membrane protein insertase